MTDNAEALPGTLEDGGSVRAAADAINSLLQKGSPSILDNNMEPIKTGAPVVEEKPVVEAAPEETPAVSEEQAPTTSDDTPVDHQGVAVAQPAPVVVEQPKAETPAPSTAEADKQLSQLTQLASHLQFQLAKDFGDIKTVDDLGKLATSSNPEDISRYNKYVWVATQLQGTQQNVQRITAERHNAWFAGEQAKLQKALPDFFDPVKGPALKAEIRAAGLRRGFTEAQLQGADASQTIALYDLMRFDKAQAAKPAAVAAAKEKAAKAPPVQKPGTPRDGTKDQTDKAMEAFNRLRKSGDVRDAAAVMRNFL